MQQQQRQQVDSLLEQLESMGSQQQPRPLDNPLLYGHYNVAYTSSSRAQSERGQRESSGHSNETCNRLAVWLYAVCPSMCSNVTTQLGLCAFAREAPSHLVQPGSWAVGCQIALGQPWLYPGHLPKPKHGGIVKHSMWH